jgi:hypothetical protein
MFCVAPIAFNHYHDHDNQTPRMMSQTFDRICGVKVSTIESTYNGTTAHTVVCARRGCGHAVGYWPPTTYGL